MRLFCLLIVLLALGVPALAQAQAQGALDCYVFSESRRQPLADLELFVEGFDSGVTNANGALRFSLMPGTYTVLIPQPGADALSIADVRVLAGEVTELIVTLRADAAPQVHQEVAAHPLASAPTGPAEPDLPTGLLKGRVVSAEESRPLENARIFVKGHGAEAVSDAAGRFELMLPVGRYTLSVIRADFSPQMVDDVVVHEQDETALLVELTPASVTLDDYTVTAPYVEGGVAAMSAVRRESSGVSEAIGAEQIAKSGDSSAAGALRRVTGLTVMGGKYVYVRGMGERYSSTLLNGATLPSPEPERRVVPLDMFPVGVLESILIQKTYSPELPGEFGGGTILLNSRGRPERFYLSASFSTGFNQDTTFRKGLTYSGGSFDWLGIDDGTRALPGNVREASDSEPLLSGDRFSQRGFTPAELKEFGESMQNVWTPHHRTIPPDFGFSLTVGDSYEVGQTPFGFLTAISFDNGWDQSKIRRNYFLVGEDGNLEASHRYEFEGLENNVQLGAMLDFSTTLARHHDLKTTTLLIRTTDDEARVYQGFNRDVGSDIRVTRLRWVERMLIVQQLSGAHTIPQASDLQIIWNYTYSRASRLEPDTREYRVDKGRGAADMWILSDRPEGNQRLFSDLVDNNHDATLGLRIPFPIWMDMEGLAETGFNVVIRDRAVDTRRFKFLHKGPLSSDLSIITQAPEVIFAPENIGPQGFQFEETTRQTDNYFADADLFAGYLSANLPLIPSLRLMAGLRVERSRQSVTTYELFNPDNDPVVAEVTMTDVLPATTLTWMFHRDMQLRAGYGMTVNRPDFRELSPATFNDVTGGRQIFGNPDLDGARIHNVDLRYEWYISGMESLSAAFFFKEFDSPIETVVIPSAQQSITYANADGARNLGVEVDFRKNFDFIAPLLEGLYLSGNAAYIWSRVVMDETAGIQTSKQRPLQGQSPYVINLQLGYDNEDWGTSLAVVYNVFGPRIVEVGAQRAPDVIEQPVHMLDFVASQKLGAGFTLSLKAKNLIDHLTRQTQGAEVVERYRRGREYSLGLGWSY